MELWGYYRRGLVVDVGCGLVLGGGCVDGVLSFLGGGFWWMLVGVGVLRGGCGAGRSVVENVVGWWGVPLVAWKYGDLV